MDGFIHSSSHSYIHPLTPVGPDFMSFKRAAGEDLTFITQLIFVFLICADFLPPRRRKLRGRKEMHAALQRGTSPFKTLKTKGNYGPF